MNICVRGICQVGYEWVVDVIGLYGVGLVVVDDVIIVIFVRVVGVLFVIVCL